MKVKVLFFGATAEAAGEKAIEIELNGEPKAENALRQIVERFPKLESHSLLFAVNEAYASGDQAINEGDELAVFTHVSGG